MPVSVHIETRGFEEKVLDSRKAATSPEVAEELVQFLRDYHVRYRMNWQGPRYMSGPFSNQFWQLVVAGWEPPTVTPNEIRLRNTFKLLGIKVRGGTITPVRANRLTIPLIPEAKGSLAREFAFEEDTPLFRVGNALMRKLGKKLQAVYALKSVVYQDPWPGALPSNEMLKTVYQSSVKRSVKRTVR